MSLDEMLRHEFDKYEIGYENISDQMPDDPGRAWWAHPQSRTAINSYVMHHSAGALDGKPSQIYDSHMTRFGGVGYHFMVNCYMSNLGLVKMVYRCRNPLTWGAHVKGQNDNKLGVCWLGSYHEVEPEPLNTGQVIFSTLRKVFNQWTDRDNAFVGHRHLAATACPGGSWVDTFLAQVNTSVPETDWVWQSGYQQALLDIQTFLQEKLNG